MLEELNEMPPTGEDTGSEDIRPHRASVLGAVLYSLGFDPGFDGPRIFGTRNTLSRVFAGTQPTKTTMLRELRPVCDAAWDPKQWKGGMMSMPFLHLARRLLGNQEPNSKSFQRTTLEARMANLEKIPEKARSWTTRRPDLVGLEETEIVRVAACAPLTALMPQGYEVRDVPCLFAALCRLAGWSVADLAHNFDLSYGDARALMSGTKEPWPTAYVAVLEELDDMDLRFGWPNIHHEGTPADVGLFWQRYGADMGHIVDSKSDAQAENFPPYAFFDPEGV